MPINHEEQLVDCLNDTFGLDLLTIDQARDWIFSDEGQRRLHEWAAEGDGAIWVPATAGRPFDQVFGDRSGVDREALSPRQAADVNVALAEIAAGLDDGSGGIPERTTPS